MFKVGNITKYLVVCFIMKHYFLKCQLTGLHQHAEHPSCQLQVAQDTLKKIS